METRGKLCGTICCVAKCGTVAWVAAANKSGGAAMDDNAVATQLVDNELVDTIGRAVPLLCPFTGCVACKGVVTMVTAVLVSGREEVPMMLCSTWAPGATV